MTQMTKIAIIILNYRTYQLTIECIQNLLEQLDIVTKIIVVDNDSQNNSELYIKEYIQNQNLQDQVIFIQSGNNGGYSYGNNIGLRMAESLGYKFSCLLNNDVIIDDPKFLSKAVEIISKREKTALVGPKIYENSKAIHPLALKRPKWLEVTLHNFFPYLSIIKNRMTRENEVASQNVYAVSGCCFIMKNEYIREIDYLDENVFLFGEEMILSEKLYQKGLEVYYANEISVFHNHSQTINTHFKLKKINQMFMQSVNIYFRDYRKDINHLKREIILLSFRFYLEVNTSIIKMISRLKND